MQLQSLAKVIMWAGNVIALIWCTSVVALLFDEEFNLATRCSTVHSKLTGVALALSDERLKHSEEEACRILDALAELKPQA